MKRFWMFLFCGLGAVFLAQSTPLRAAAAEGLTLCAQSVIPALFPFMVVASLLISLGFGTWLSPFLAPLMALYGLPGWAGAAVVLGLVGGYPIGAKTAARLCVEGRLTRSEGARLLTFCNNSGPVFLISVLGQGIFGSFRAGVYLWLIHLLSALLAGLLLRDKEEHRAPPPPLAPKKGPSLPAAFVDAVRESSLTMVSVCGFVVFFYVLSRPLTALPAPLSTAAVGVVELFSMTPLVTSDRLGFVLASACAAFGGLSVLFQSAAALEGSGLSAASLAKGKALQGFLAGALAFLLWPVL